MPPSQEAKNERFRTKIETLERQVKALIEGGDPEAEPEPEDWKIVLRLDATAIVVIDSNPDAASKAMLLSIAEGAHGRLRSEDGANAQAYDDAFAAAKKQLGPEAPA